MPSTLAIRPDNYRDRVFRSLSADAVAQAGISIAFVIT